jgi:hypothetical protein
MTLTFPGWNGYVACEVSTGPRYTSLWETDSPFANFYSITLNDSIDNYDEFIVYGSANRDSQRFFDTQNRYTVTKNAINRCPCYVVGRWNDGSTYILMDGTDMRLSGTSGYITSSFFVGQNNGTTDFTRGMFTSRNADLHPYKIVGVKENQ